MPIILPSDLEREVERKVKSGAYRDTDEVLREALQLLIEHDAREERKLEALRKDIQEGLDEIDRGNTVDAFDALREMRARVEKGSGSTR